MDDGAAAVECKVIEHQPSNAEDVYRGMWARDSRYVYVGGRPASIRMNVALLLEITTASDNFLHEN